jgi:hypothetical protein
VVAAVGAAAVLVVEVVVEAAPDVSGEVSAGDGLL